MTIKNEAIRLFFAVSALILVGMLASPAEEQSSDAFAKNEKPQMETKELEAKAFEQTKEPVEQMTARKARKIVLNRS